MNRRRAIAGVGALVLATCCPTLWVQVQKDAPSPWPAVAMPEFGPQPPAVPAAMPNRFDVLAGGAPTLAAAGYTDAPGPRAAARALEDRQWILDTYGHAAATRCGVQATLRCARRGASGLEALCHELVLPAAVDAAAAVVIGDKRIAVVTPPSAARPSAELDLAEYVAGTDGDAVRVCVEPTLGLSRPLLAFVHLSDIQLRDPSVTLTDRRVSHALDWFDPLSSFEYDDDQAFYNQYLLEAVVGTINAIAANPAVPEPPRLVIHSGDSIDAGTVGELERFHAVIDRLRLPFFELFGNHDVLVFGNLTPTATHDTDAACAPVADLLGQPLAIARRKLCVDQLVRCPTCVGREGELVAKASQASTRSGFIERLRHARAEVLAPTVARGLRAVAADERGYCPDTKPVVRADAYSRAHGFDLGTANSQLDGEPLGYYAFATALDDGARNAVFIALDTEDLDDHRGGTRGRVGAAQLGWLGSVLDCVRASHPHDLVLVFGHQPLGAIDTPADAGGSVAGVLEAHAPNVVGYFYGHHHAHAICADARPGRCSQFWEVETASLVEFPQEGRMVRIKEVGDGLAFFELTALREQIAEPSSMLASYVARARAGAERDYCFTQRETPHGRCSPDQRPYRTDGRDANARLFFRLP